MREWFTAIVLLSPTLMQGVAAENRVVEAVRMADQLIAALAVPRVPTIQSMKAPTKKELRRWEKNIAETKEKKDREGRDTCPAGPSAKKRTGPVSSQQPVSHQPTSKFGAVLPGPLVNGVESKPPPLTPLPSNPPPSLSLLPPAPPPVISVREPQKPLPTHTRYKHVRGKIIEE